MGGLQQAFLSKYEVTTFSRMINCLQCTGLYPPYFINVKKVRRRSGSNQPKKLPIPPDPDPQEWFSFYWVKDNDIYFSVADQNPGSGAFFTPGSGMGQKIRIRDEQPDHISESLETIF
jgi:hypothetical protein